MRRLLLILALCGATIASAIFLGAPRATRPRNAPSPPFSPHGKRLAQRANDWKTVAPGVSMRRFQTRADGMTIPIVALRAAPSRIHIATLAGATSLGATNGGATNGGATNGANASRGSGFDATVAGADALDASEWRRKTGAMAAINGGFFTPSGQSLGLRMSRRREKAALRAAEWGVFYVRRGSARILHTTDWKKRAQTRRAQGVLVADEAIQCGPRLVVAGQTVKLKPQWARRTGIGLQSDGKVIVAISEAEMSFQAWAALWASPRGLDCRDALNLDGGGSTQISVAAAASQGVEVGGLWPVPDAVVIR